MIEWTTSAKAELERLLSSHQSGLQHRGAAPDLHCSRAMGRPRGGSLPGTTAIYPEDSRARRSPQTKNACRRASWPLITIDPNREAVAQNEWGREQS